MISHLPLTIRHKLYPLGAVCFVCAVSPAVAAILFAARIGTTVGGGAARAGEQGKGFAVAAGEVRKLAERSQLAAQQIGEMAGTLPAVADRAGRSLSDGEPALQETSHLVRYIAATSQQQSTGVGEINATMGQLNGTAQGNAASSHQLATIARALSAHVEILERLVGRVPQQPRPHAAARLHPTSAVPSASGASPRSSQEHP